VTSRVVDVDPHTRRHKRQGSILTVHARNPGPFEEP
jgi:hypothetical protein